MRFLKSFQKLPVQLFVTICSALFLGKVLDLKVVSLFYTISSCFIEVLIFILPLMIFSYIFRALTAVSKGSFLLVFLIFLGVTLSNCLALSAAFLYGKIFLPLVGLMHAPDFAEKFSSSVSIVFRLDLPSFIGPEKAMITGIVAGLALNFISPDNHIRGVIQKVCTSLGNAIGIFLQKIFIPLLPLYIFGFCLKLSYDDALFHLFQQYGKVFLLSMFLVVCYIGLIYFISAKGNVRSALNYLKLMLPAGLTAFSTMSSAATMPVTLECVEKTTKDKNFSDIIIPSTANIHMLGDDLTIVLTSLTLLSVFGMSWPTGADFLPFMLAFSVAKLSCVGIPGASVLVILPVLQSYLGFTPEMISLLTTIYILQDPFGTAANVMGNGGFALIIQKIFYLLPTSPSKAEKEGVVQKSKAA
jgi:Na+/H+-dicarboxylate symporter